MLALPGEVGSWQRECKGYQFWTRADTDGFFTISYIRTGDYNLYAWVPSFIGDYKNDVNITVTEGLVAEKLGWGNEEASANSYWPIYLELKFGTAWRQWLLMKLSGME
ncbi:hypothetical protein MRB53_013866 [Persea americana]|uniref:Uncharacterized protein n=1 Tax=Persea americana TaxID=3435 RepID=A0ACC2K958_PERAE|nr:hypothetical protein MRB53_013866 [Persea americana]